jgi:hypothetical protein
VLPRYTLRREPELGSMVLVEGFEVADDRFGVFWLRSGTTSLPLIAALCEWLRVQQL